MVTSYEAFSLLLLLLPGIVGFFFLNAISDLKVTDTLTSLSWVVFFTIAAQILSIQVAGTSFFPQFAAETDAEVERNIQAYLESLSVIPLAFGAGLGIVFAVLNNWSVFHWCLNKARITHRVGARQPWGAVFNRKRGVWIVVRFKDGSSLVGWPEYYSDDQEGTQQIYVQDASWRVPAAKSETFVPNAGAVIEETDVGAVLLQDMSNVVAIEFREPAGS